MLIAVLGFNKKKQMEAASSNIYIYRMVLLILLKYRFIGTRTLISWAGKNVPLYDFGRMFPLSALRLIYLDNTVLLFFSPIKLKKRRIWFTIIGKFHQSWNQIEILNSSEIFDFNIWNPVFYGLLRVTLAERRRKATSCERRI